MENVVRLSRVEGIPEYIELDLRINRMTCMYLMEAMKGHTMASLSEHVQLLVMQIIKNHHQLNDEREYQHQTALHLPSSVKAINMALGVRPAEDVGLAKDLLMLALEDSIFLVQGNGMVPEQFIDMKVWFVTSQGFYMHGKSTNISIIKIL